MESIRDLSILDGQSPLIYTPGMEERKYRIKNAVGDCVLLILEITALTLILTVISLITEVEFMHRIEIVALINLIAFGVIMYIRSSENIAFFKDFFRVPKNMKRILPQLIITAFGLTAVLSEIDNLLRPIIGDFILYDPPMDLSSYKLLPFFITAVIVAPLTEELFFRGYLLKRLGNTVSKHAGIIVTALLFGIFHLNIIQLLAGFFSGLILGYLAYSTASLIYPIIFHALYNGIPSILGLLKIRIPGYTEIQETANQPIWFTLLGLGLLALGVYSLLRTLPELHSRSEDPQREEFND